MKKLQIIDTLGPFVEPTDQPVINWSKVNFSHLETNNRLKASVRRRIVRRFETYTARTKALGYNAMSFDDLAHMVVLPEYSAGLSLLLGDYRSLYKQLFTVATRHNMKIFINTDYLFFNDDIERLMDVQNLTHETLFIKMLTTAFEDFPEIAGIILRIGENDGKDVKNHFLSRLVLRTPGEINALLKKILPFFERHNKTLIFRTWTVGVYPVGDLIWNKRTFDAVFDSIDSSALVISMKFGDTDFMKYLKLNPLFFTSNHKKIIELQTRREWEGMGMFPSFVGWDYYSYFRELARNDTIVGIHVWCQTGGWAKKAWTNVMFLGNNSFWNELNTYVAIGLYRKSCTVESAVASFCRDYKIKDVSEFIRLLQLAEIAIMQGLYIRELAERQLYFRRSRVPTIVWLAWDTLLLQPVMLLLVRALVTRPDIAIQEAQAAAEAVAEMLIIAEKLELQKPVVDSLKFQYATFVLFVGIKKYIFGMLQPRDMAGLQKQIYSYTSQFPQHYSIPPLLPSRLKPKYVRITRYMLRLVVRSQPVYRVWDKILLATSPLQRRVVQYYLRKTKSSLSEQSMGIDVLFR
jgi:hypothetical protein